MDLKEISSIWSVKMIKGLIKFSGRGKGESLPGKIARKLDKKILTDLSQFANTIIVTGTNGKTTTSNLISSILKQGNLFVINNSEGNNLINGITQVYTEHAYQLKKLAKTKWAVIECDEATVIPLLKEVHPVMIVINNFFRDQLDRYGEIDALINKMHAAIDKSDAKLILNTDDPFVARFSDLKNEKLYFGINKDAYNFENSNMKDSLYCPSCGRKLSYEHMFYGQLGYYKCDFCGFKREQPKYEIKKIERNDKGYNFKLKTRDESSNNSDDTDEENDLDYQLSLFGVYNLYNALSALSVAKELNIADKAIYDGLNNFKLNNGRMTVYQYNGCDHIVNLIKNPSGADVAIEEINHDKKDKRIVLFLNDMAADGNDVSWIWDADFEKLTKTEVSHFLCGGRRAWDMANRLKYAGIDPAKIKVIPNIKKAVEFSLEYNEKTYYLPNYTALERVNKLLMSKVKKDIGEENHS